MTRPHPSPITFLAAAALLINAGSAQDSLKVRSQYPSPMAESTRAHERLVPREYPGLHRTVSGILPKPVDVFIPQRFLERDSLDLLIHFHGAPYVVHFAAESSGLGLIAAAVNLGGGSRVYNDPFEDSTAFARLVAAILDSTAVSGKRLAVRRILLSGFSAGYGAIRRILSTNTSRGVVDGALLLDGIHASYIPERTVLAEGGGIDSTQLEAFRSFAEECSTPGARKRFVITHSEIFPGTFVSTTESTDWILKQLNMKRDPVLLWGPLGMQQVSRSEKGNFKVFGFAGNAAQDHVDHLQALWSFLRNLRE